LESWAGGSAYIENRRRKERPVTGRTPGIHGLPAAFHRFAAELPLCSRRVPEGSPATTRQPRDLGIASLPLRSGGLPPRFRRIAAGRAVGRLRGSHRPPWDVWGVGAEKG